jgi:hypothetical protein
VVSVRQTIHRKSDHVLVSQDIAGLAPPIDFSVASVRLHRNSDSDFLEIAEDVMKSAMVDAITVCATQIYSQSLEALPFGEGKGVFENLDGDIGKIGLHPIVSGSRASGARQGAPVGDLHVERPDRNVEKSHGVH